MELPSKDDKNNVVDKKTEEQETAVIKVNAGKQKNDSEKTRPSFWSRLYNFTIEPPKTIVIENGVEKLVLITPETTATPKTVLPKEETQKPVSVWYQLHIKEIMQKLGTSEEGLTDNEVSKRLQRYGLNKLVEEEKIGRLKILFHQFTSPLIYILLVAAVVTSLLKEYIDTGVIMAVVVLNAVIGYIQEYKAEKGVRALKKMLIPGARVLRNGKEKEINSEQLVPGDVVLLSSGPTTTPSADR